MRFKIDENLPVEFADLLKSAHHDAETVVSEHLQGQPDAGLLGACQAENRILVTLDLDFANLRSYPPAESPGFVVLRPRWQDKYHLLDLFGKVLPLLQREQVEHRLWIVEEDRVRIRGGEG